MKDYLPIFIGIAISIVASIITSLIVNQHGHNASYRRWRANQRRDSHRVTPPHLPTVPNAPSPASIPPVAFNVNRRAHATTPPALPRQTMNTMSFSDIYSFPRCPVCRCSNRPGRPQVVFRNPAHDNWKCVDGHEYNS